jgi:GxxExxY protein
VVRLTDEEFRRADYAVMQHAFACHNEFGRLCDEDIYRNDIATRLTAAGLGQVRTEVPLTVTWREFRKLYYLDLIVGEGLLYEFKTVAALAAEHKAQLLNYVLLLQLQTAKLLNFRSQQVESWFSSSQLTLDARRNVQCDVSRWRELTPACADCRCAMVEILTEFGAFLDVALYEEMLTWFLGGEQNVIRRIPLVRNGVTLGSHRCHLLTPDVAFSLTAHREQIDRAESHLRRFLQHTALRGIQWINLNHAEIQFVTITKP